MNNEGSKYACGFAVFFGAVLVFQVQPIAGRFLLPAFGGGAAVWTACLFFFQFALLAGYAYAHALTSWASPRAQATVHAALLLVSLLFLPLGFATGNTIAENPGIAIALALVLSIGVPFVVLAGTAPLMQRWYALAESRRSPYRLYALSNAGALLALLTYPFLVEPALALEAQTLAWSGAYAVFLVASLIACVLTWLRNPPVAASELDTPAAGIPAVNAAAIVALAAGGVVMLLAVTNQLTQNVAPIPFLWILPLVVYLLTWIMTFSGERYYDRSIWGSLFIVAASCMILLEYFATSFDIVPVIVTYVLVLACICVVCHGEIYRLRPAPARLGSYYLLIAAGGALGGASVSLIAPLLFDRYWEGLAGVYLVYLVFGGLVLREYRRDRGRPVHAGLESLRTPVDHWARRLFIAGWVTGIVLFPAVIASVHTLLPQNDIVAWRNFYGILNVRDDYAAKPPRRQLVDGTTIHGFQLLSNEREHEPTSYYAAHTGVGRLLRQLAQDDEALSTGVIGLGVGTLAAYGRAGDIIRFYELNPAVVSVAGQHFTFLENSLADIDVVPGDARISLERELRESGSRGYDLLVIDAFSSDAIPVHLLTREALQLYRAHLVEDGVLAFHVTNDYLDLGPVLAKVAAALDLRALQLSSPGGGGVGLAADWVFIHAGDNPPLAASDAVYLSPSPEQPLWTDDYSDLLGALK